MKAMYKSFWIRNHGMFCALKSIYNKFDHHREIEIIKIRKLHYSNMIKRRFNKRITRFAETMVERNINHIRHGLNSSMILLNEPAINKAKNILVEFLSDAADKYTVFHKNLAYYNKANYLVDFFKRRAEIKKVKFVQYSIMMYVLYKHISDKCTI